MRGGALITWVTPVHLNRLNLTAAEACERPVEARRVKEWLTDSDRSERRRRRLADAWPQPEQLSPVLSQQRPHGDVFDGLP